MTMPGTLTVNGARLWDTILASARIGPGRTPTGLRRLALTDADREMRDLFARWCRDAGCTVTVDRMGNMFARRPGSDDSLPPVLVGSHLDTQIAGGRYDGILGVLAALEIVRTFNDAGVRTRRPIEIVNWTNEEGARFQPPMLGSAVFAGVRTLEWGHARTDDAGRTVGEELRRIGYAGTAPVGGRAVDAYFELHIEQGPLLDDKGIPVGVVAGTYAVRGMNVEIRGETAHSGPTPMAARRNALVGGAMLIVAVNEIGWSYAPDGKATTSRIEVCRTSPASCPTTRRSPSTCAIPRRRPWSAWSPTCSARWRTVRSAPRSRWPSSRRGSSARSASIPSWSTSSGAPRRTWARRRWTCRARPATTRTTFPAWPRPR